MAGHAKSAAGDEGAGQPSEAPPADLASVVPMPKLARMGKPTPRSRPLKPERSSTDEAPAPEPVAIGAPAPGELAPSETVTDASPLDEDSQAAIDADPADLAGLQAGSDELDSLEASAADFDPEPAAETASIEGSGLLEPALPKFDEDNSDAFDEFEHGELANDSTRIDERQELSEESTLLLADGPEPATLLVEAGKDVGRDFVIQEGTTSIGRGIDNDVILTDISVSRRHLRLEYDVGGVRAIDLDSGNGTLLNGEPIHHATLASGDRIEIGETVLLVRLPGQSFQAPAAGAIFETTNDEFLPSIDSPQPLDSWAPPSAGLPEGLGSHSALVSGSRLLPMSRGALLVAAIVLVVFASTVGAIAMAVLLHRDSGAGTPVALPITPPAVPSASPAPVIVPPPSASPLVPIAPATVAPTAPASPLEATAMAGPSATPTAPVTPRRSDEPSPTTPRTAAATSSPRAEPARGSRRGEAPPRGGERASASPNDPRILAAYRRSSFSEASLLARTQASSATGAQRTALTQLASNIDVIRQRLPEARRGNLTALEQAIRLDRQIAGSRGVFADELVPRLANAYVARARPKMSSRPTEACRDVRAALAIASQHAEARSLFRDCEGRAQRILAEARGLEAQNAAQARRLYEQVSAIVGVNHALSNQATARLVVLNRRTPVRRGPVDEDE